MKKLLLFGFIGTMLASCIEQTGELTGVAGRQIYQPEVPLGMVYVRSGGFQMGETDHDVPFLFQTRPRPVSVQAFYMDNTEISNNEYRQFVNWVRDSIAREILYTKNKDWVKGLPGDGKDGKQEMWQDADATSWIKYEEYYLDESDLADAGTTKYIVSGKEDKESGEVVHDADKRLEYRGEYNEPKSTKSSRK